MVGREFKYLEEKYGKAGAREVFEKICFDLVNLKNNGASMIQPYPGDDGIDILLKKGNKMDVYQCKFFIDRIEEVQRQQIRKAFKSLINSQFKGLVETWTLCIATTLTSNEMQWWNTWSEKKGKEFSIKMRLMDKNAIISELKNYNLYDSYFNTLTIDKKFFNSLGDKEYIECFSPLMSEISRNDFRFTDGNFIIYVEDLVMKYEYNPRFKDSNFIIYLNDLIAKISFNAQNGFIKDQNILNEIFEIRKNICIEYEKLFMGN